MIQRILILGITTVFALLSLSCEDTIEGDWEGTLDVQGRKLGVNFHIIKSGDAYSSSMDVPSQNAENIQTTSTTFKNNELVILLENMQIEYKGSFNNGIISGTYTQRGQSFPLSFTRMAQNAVSRTRPQDPKEPYPYTSENINFINDKANNLELAGTLTLPENIEKPPVVILMR